MQPWKLAYLAFLSLLLFSLGASAHEPKEFTVILSEETAIPSSIGAGILVETDSLFFINVDERERSSHRILVDADGDGEFNGSDDFSTPWLRGSCELHENGTKVDSDCMITASVFLGPQNGLLPGNVSMLHQIHIGDDMSENQFYANFGLDEHTLPSPANNPENLADNGVSEGNPLVLLLTFSIIGIIITAPKLFQPGE